MPMSIPQRPGGSSGQVQFNDGGTAAGTDRLTWNKATSTLTVRENLLIQNGFGSVTGIAMGWSQFGLASTTTFRWSSGLSGASGHDIIHERMGVGIFGQHNGANAQQHQWYGTRTDASNYRRVALGMSTAGVGYLRAEGAGTGASGNTLAVSTGALTVASLPPASSVPYTRLAVTDATATTWMSAVTGGGANKVPVWSDGTTWLIA